jgi:hypothetical protein
MKKLKQIITACCLFISVASLVFMTTTANAQSHAKENPMPNAVYAYVPVGNDVTISGSGGSGCNTATLGATTTCNGSGWKSGTCGGPLKGCCTITGYSWVPATYLSCTTCQHPVCTPPACDGTISHITYTLTVTASDCFSDCATVNVQLGPCCYCCRIGHFSSQDEQDSPDIQIFPNPSNGQVTVQFQEITANTSLQVYSMEGALVMEKTNISRAGKTVFLDLSSYAKGTYFVQVLDGDKGVMNKKILIQ